MPSISTMIVCKSDRVIRARPRTFFSVFFVNPISLSQKPPYQRARFGMKIQSQPRRLNASFTVTESRRRFNSSANDKYVVALSETIYRGSDLRLTNLRNALRKVSSLKSSTTSKCIARVFAQVNKHTYAFVSLNDVLT